MPSQPYGSALTTTTPWHYGALKNARLFQPMFGSNMDKPNHWFKF